MFENIFGKNRTESQKDESRPSHIQWAKERAKALVDKGELQKAIDSFVSDLRKEDVDVRGPNPLKENSLPGDLGLLLKTDPNLNADMVLEYLDGFSD